MTWDDAYEFCEQLLADIDDLPEKAEEFADSVKKKVTGMQEWIEQNHHVTDKMVTALENIRRGVDKWLHREPDRGSR